MPRGVCMNFCVVTREMVGTLRDRSLVIDISAFIRSQGWLIALAIIVVYTFLGGYLAAGMSETGVVCTFGGVNIPPVTEFMVGFQNGVEYYNAEKGADVTVLGWDNELNDGAFTGNFRDKAVSGKVSGMLSPPREKLTTTVASADLAVTKTVDDASPDEGDSITFRVVLRNLGPDDATGVVVTDTLDPNVTFSSASTVTGDHRGACAGAAAR